MTDQTPTGDYTLLYRIANDSAALELRQTEGNDAAWWIKGHCTAWIPLDDVPVVIAMAQDLCVSQGTDLLGLRNAIINAIQDLRRALNVKRKLLRVAFPDEYGVEDRRQIWELDGDGGATLARLEANLAAVETIQARTADLFQVIQSVAQRTRQLNEQGDVIRAKSRQIGDLKGQLTDEHDVLAALLETLDAVGPGQTKAVLMTVITSAREAVDHILHPPSEEEVAEPEV